MVQIVDLTDQPDRVLTNDKRQFKQNIANCPLSFILYYSDGCGACRHFHPLYVKYANKFDNTGTSFFKITSNGDKQTDDAIEVLTKHCPKDQQGYIPLLMVFCGNKFMTSHVGGFDGETDKEQLQNLHKFVMDCHKRCSRA